MKRHLTSLLPFGLALTITVGGTSPSFAQSPAPPITIETVPSDEAPAAQTPAPAAKAAAPAGPPAAAKKSTEVLPWTNKPLAPVAVAPTGDTAAADAAAAQCVGLFEAACRDLKTCAWVADIALVDGTIVPARCVARPPAPPKSAKKTAPVKKTAKAPAEAPETTAAPAVKASVTRIEDEEPAAKPEKKKAATELAKPVAPPQEEPAPAVQAKAPEPEQEATPPAESKQAEKPEETKKVEEVRSPIVVKPPPEPDRQQMPSFGSVSPIMPGGGNAIVVTVPPSE